MSSSDAQEVQNAGSSSDRTSLLEPADGQDFLVPPLPQDVAVLGVKRYQLEVTSCKEDNSG